MLSIYIKAEEDRDRMFKSVQFDIDHLGNIRSRTKRIRVLQSYTTAQQLLKQYTTLPENGLVLFAGVAQKPDGEFQSISLCLDPVVRIQKTIFQVDKLFRVQVGLYHFVSLLQTAVKLTYAPQQPLLSLLEAEFLRQKKKSSQSRIPLPCPPTTS